MTDIGTVIDGKYEILREIGRGGMSVVYLAMDTHLNKQWAVKEIRKQGSGKNDEIVVNSLLAEANMMKRLDHPALPRIVDIIDNGVTIYVVMDYIEGESLDKILDEYGSQPEEKVIEWAMQIADALSYLHAQKPPIIYRDMKPANVMLKPEGNIKIIDFGIAREYKEQNLADTTVLGTKGYAPPEQYSGQTDPRSDIFALGMTMHHLLTGTDPRSGEPYVPVRQWNPELSEGIEIIVDKCVQPAAENRYQNCADLIYDLEHPELITKGFKKKQKRKLRTFIAAAVMAVLAAVSGYVCSEAAVAINNDEYAALVDVPSSTSLDMKVQSYTKAMDIYPGDTRAYFKLLEAYQDEGRFGSAESDQFLALYNANYKQFDTNSAEVAELKYEIGLMYFNYYSGTAASAQDLGMLEKVKRAKSYFEENYNNTAIATEFEDLTLSNCYHHICQFYDEFVLSTNARETSRDDYVALFETIDGALEAVDNYSGAREYDKLSLYNSVFFLIHDQSVGMAQDGFDKTVVLDTLDTVYRKAEALTVNKEQNKELRREIVDNYESYRAAVETAYKNAEKG